MNHRLVQSRTVYIAVIVAIAVVWTATPTCASSPPASAAAIRLLQSVSHVLRSASIWTASYRQEYIAAGMTAGDTASGTVWISWPDHALFSSKGAGGRIMGLEGRQVRLLDLESRTCDDHLLTEDEWERIPLAAILDPASATARFSVTLDGHGHLVLRPLHPGGIARVEMTLDHHLPAAVLITDPQGAVNRFEFHGWTKRSTPPPGGWLPAPPAGIVCTVTAGVH